MNSHIRATATAKRERFWNVFDHVPQDQQTGGCAYCEMGWAEGPGLVYRCGNCNPGKSGDPHTYATDNAPVPDRPRGWWSWWFQPWSYFTKRPPTDPECFASAPGPQQQAENDCHRCGAVDRCLPSQSA